MADDEEDQRGTPLATNDTITERDFVLLLISLYRDFPVLWKVRSKEYSDKNKRSIALQNIVKTLRIYKPTYTEELLKKKINSLRTNFNKEKCKIEKAMRSGASGDDVPKPSLYYFDELLFLSDQICISDTESSISSEISGSPNHQKEIRSLPQPKKSKKTTQDDLIEIASQYFKRPDSESDVIAKSWAIKLNRLAPDQRRYAEKIINDVLFEGEMGMLSRNGVRFLPASLPTYSSPSSPSPFRPARVPTPNLHHLIMPRSYQSPLPDQSPNSTMTHQPRAPRQSPSPNAHNSTMTYQSPAPHQSSSPNARHSTITYQTRTPHQSSTPNARHSTITYQTRTPHQSSSPNARHSTIPYQTRTPHPSSSPNARHSTITYQSPAPHQSSSPNAHHSTLTYQSRAPNQSPSPNPHYYEQPVEIHLPEPATETDELLTAVKFIENFYSF